MTTPEGTRSRDGGEPVTPGRVGRYELVERLGKGGMSIVYRARDTVLGRSVAVKMLISDLESLAETRERFFREARAAGQLSHRNIVTVYDFGEEAGRAFIVMELLQGESLNALLERGADLSLEERLDIMMGVCEGLGFAHARGIVHRDVKPGNIFRTTDGQVKILDFGVARIASSQLTRSGLLVGTPEYMSPEQVQGKAVDQRSDIFSAGVVFYQLLSGRKPFQAKALPMLLHKIVTEEAAPLTEAEAPPELARIIARALEKDPERRYQRMEELLVDLTRFARRFEQETRALAGATYDRYCEVEALCREHDALAAELGIGVPSEQVGVAAALAELPLFQEVGKEVLRLVPFRRAKLEALRRDLDVQYERLAATVEPWRGAASTLRAAQEAASAGRFADAIAQVEGEAARLPAASRLSGLLIRWRAGLAVQEAARGRETMPGVAPSAADETQVGAVPGGAPRGAPVPGPAPGRIRLVVWRGAACVATLTPGDRPVTIGRSRQCDVVLDDSAVSRLHARLVLGDEGPLLVDEHSQNGLWVDGRRAERVVLWPGTVVTLGPYRLVAEAGVETESAGEEAPGGERTIVIRRPVEPVAAEPTGPAPVPGPPEPAPEERPLAPVTVTAAAPAASTETPVPTPAAVEEPIAEAIESKAIAPPRRAALAGVAAATAGLAASVARSMRTVAAASGRAARVLAARTAAGTRAMAGRFRALSAEHPRGVLWSSIGTLALIVIVALAAAVLRRPATAPPATTPEAVEPGAPAGPALQSPPPPAPTVPTAQGQTGGPPGEPATVPVAPPAAGPEAAGAASGAPGAARPAAGRETARDFIRAARRPGESTRAWQDRSRALTERYRAGIAAFERGDLKTAEEIWAGLVAEEPGFGDTAERLAQVRAELRTRRRAEAEAAFETGRRLEGEGNLVSALASYQQAEQIDSTIEGLAEAIATLRAKMRREAEELMRRAKVEDAFGRVQPAIGLYRRVVELLPPGDPMRVEAEQRLQKLQGIRQSGERVS